MKVRLLCNKCGGQKFIGEKYYAFGTYYVDITCVICADSVDVEVEKLNKLLLKLEEKSKKKNNAKPETNRK